MLCLGQALFGRSGAVWRLLLMFLAMASVIAVALTKSRGGMIGLGVGGVALATISLIMLRRTMPSFVFKSRRLLRPCSADWSRWSCGR